MDSLQILEAKISIRNYLKGLNMPAEVKRLILTELTSEINNDVGLEVKLALAEREKEVSDVSE